MLLVLLWQHPVYDLGTVDMEFFFYRDDWWLEEPSYRGHEWRIWRRFQKRNERFLYSSAVWINWVFFVLTLLINSCLIIFLLVYLFVEKSLILRSHHCQIKPTHLIYDLLAGSNLYNYGLSVGNDFSITSDVTYDLGFFQSHSKCRPNWSPFSTNKGYWAFILTCISMKN